jgi:hypothetical protein
VTVVARPTNWSLDAAEWDVLRALLTREPLCWSHVDFRRAASNAVPERSGLYAICSTPVVPLGEEGAPPLLNILYVGISDSSIRSRFRYHLDHSAKCPMIRARRVFSNRLLFYWCLTATPEVYENAIYRCFGPAVNAVAPPRFQGRLGAIRTI